MTEEIKQIQKEIEKLKQQKLQCERNKVTEVNKLLAGYTSRRKNAFKEAAEKIRPLAEVHQQKLVNLNRDYKVEQARIQKDIEEQITALKRSMQSRLTKAKNESDSTRDKLSAEHKSATDAIEHQMYKAQEDLELEAGIGAETMTQEYDSRLAEIDEQLSVLEEALAIDQGDDKEQKQRIRDEADKRRNDRQAADIARRKKAIEDAVKRQGGPLKQVLKKKPGRKQRRRSA